MCVICFRCWQRIASYWMLLALQFIYSVGVLILLPNIYSFRILFLLVWLVIVPLFVVLCWNSRCWNRNDNDKFARLLSWINTVCVVLLVRELVFMWCCTGIILVPFIGSWYVTVMMLCCRLRYELDLYKSWYMHTDVFFCTVFCFGPRMCLNLVGMLTWQVSWPKLVACKMVLACGCW